MKNILSLFFFFLTVFASNSIFFEHNDIKEGEAKKNLSESQQKVDDFLREMKGEGLTEKELQNLKGYLDFTLKVRISML